MRFSFSVLSFFILLAILVTFISFAQNNKTLEEGIKFYRQENYDEALNVFKKARDEDPNSSLAAYYLGLTYKQLQNYKEAKTHLKDAVTLTPKIKGALLELVEVLYQLNEFQEAHEYIAVAEKEGIRPAQTAFLKGLVLLKDNRNIEAIESFNTAKQLDKALAQTADYQIGIAYLKEKKFTEAKDVFKEVVVFDPNTDIASFANQYLEALKRKEELEKPFKFSVSAAFQYDDNVLLRPSDATVAADITNQEDTRQIITGKAEYNKRFSENLGLNLQYSLYFAKQNDLGNYDVLSNTGIITPSLYFKNATVGLPVSYNHTIVGDKDYLATIGTTPLINFRIGQTQMGQLSLKYQNKDFLRTPTTADENRDSDEYGAGAGWYKFFAKNKGFFNLRYDFNLDDTKGNNWEYFGHKASAALLVPVFEKLKASIIGEAFLQDFENTHTVYNVKREDKVYTASTMLAYNFWKDAELQLRYTYVKDNSNIVIYDYDRNIYSAGIEYKF